MSIDRVKLDQETDVKKLLDMLKSWDEEENQRYQARHHEWEKNLLFYLGKHWLEDRGTSVSDGYTILEEDDDNYRPVTNYVFKACEIKRSQILGKNLRPKVPANSDKKDDRDSSRLATLALRAKHDIDNEDMIHSLLLTHAQIFGICYRADFKQPHPYESLEEPIMSSVENEFYQCTDGECSYIESEEESPEGMEEESPEGMEEEVLEGMEEEGRLCPHCGSMMEKKSEATEEQELDDEGRPRVETIPIIKNKVMAVDPFRIKISAAQTQDDITWVTESTIQQVSWIKDAFNVDAPGYLPDNLGKIKKLEKLPRALKISEDFKNAVIHNHSSLFKDISKSSESGSTCKNEEETTILRKSYFCPSKKFKMGRLIIWDDNAIVYDGLPDIPLRKTTGGQKRSKRWHCYNLFPYSLNPSSVEGIAYVAPLIPVNKQVNSLDSILFEHLEKSATPTEVRFSNTMMNEDDNTDGIIELNGNPSLPNGGAPFYLNVPQMASEVYRMRGDRVEELYKLGNVTEITQGLRPAGVDTYRGLQLLKDASDSSEAELYNRWFAFFREGQKLKISILQECLLEADDELLEMMETIRQNEDMGKEQIVAFSGADLRDNLNVTVEESDYMSNTKSAEADRVRAALADQLMMPEQIADAYTQTQLFRRLGMGEIPLPKKADIEKAERIIQYLEAGQFEEVMGTLSHIDDKPLQVRIWTDWMKTAKFESLEDSIKQAAGELLKYTENELFKAQQEKMKNQPPPPPGEGAQPPPPRG